jgi:hypothetical protein
LAEHEEDERRVEEVLASGHVAIICGRRGRGIGARVESRVDLELNPRWARTMCRSRYARLAGRSNPSR